MSRRMPSASSASLIVLGWHNYDNNELKKRETGRD